MVSTNGFYLPIVNIIHTFSAYNYLFPVTLFFCLFVSKPYKFIGRIMTQFSMLLMVELWHRVEYTPTSKWDFCQAFVIPF